MKLPTINKVTPKHVILIITLLIFSISAIAKTEDGFYKSNVKMQALNDQNSGVDFLSSLSNETEEFLVYSDSIQIIKDQAVHYANMGNSQKAVANIIKYISLTSDMSFINDHLFRTIENTSEYQALKEKYAPRLSLLGVFYFFVGTLGVFVFWLLNIKKGRDKMSNFLISLFVLFHSVFMLHLVLYVINCQFYFPHALLVSTTFSFLYGPLLYFYYKRIIYNYKFKLVDVLHLLPSVVLLIYIFPYYLMPRLEKFNEIFNQSNTLLPGAYTIIIVKILSLTIYAYLLLKMYFKHSGKSSQKQVKSKHLWQRNIIVLHALYTVSYIIYATVLVKIVNIPLLFHLQTIVMVGVVFYVTFIAYEQPEIFKGNIKLLDPSNLFKYKKSGLSPTYSIALRDDLLKLLNEDKIYKEKDVSLESLSERLQTSKHNTSQVINAHFEMSFFELMNKYRIGEAADIFQKDDYNNLSIIEVAYEVGFNNKVSFNKSFKKQFELTPSEYIKSLKM